MAATDGDKETPPKILIVEDEAGERCFLESLLEDEYVVESASDGESAEEALGAFRPDLVLLDVVLGGTIDGVELCRRVKKEQQRHDVKIIILTGSEGQEVKLSALEAGANDFLRKPASPPELLTRVGNLLREADLERRLRARNEELEEALRQLKAAQAQVVLAEQLNTVGTMAAGLLHEISNPLSYSLTALRVAFKSAPDASDDYRTEAVKDAIEGMERIGQIIGDLKALAHQPEPSEMETVALRRLVETALCLAWKDLGDPDVEVHMRVDPYHCVRGHGGQLAYVLTNLVRNAAEAMQRGPCHGSPSVWVKSEAHGSEVRLTVSDNGPGVSPEHLPRIFDPFFTSKDVGKGMGLGLAFAQRIAQYHGTAVTVQNREEGGAEFAISLDRVWAPEDGSSL